jgi:hypothetical protein
MRAPIQIKNTRILFGEQCYQVVSDVVSFNDLKPKPGAVWVHGTFPSHDSKETIRRVAQTQYKLGTSAPMIITYDGPERDFPYYSRGN